MLNKRELIQIFEEKNIKKYRVDETLKKYSTWKIGGPVDCVVDVSDLEELVEVINLVKRYTIPFFVMGNGSNTLFPDEGIRGLGIRLIGEFGEMTIQPPFVKTGAGLPMVILANRTAGHQLKGMEFAAGIPGCVGGSLVMNAGANGREISDFFIEALILTKEGNVQKIKKDELSFGYRHSSFMQMEDIILFAYFRLEPEDYPSQAKDTIAKIKDTRLKTQPYEKATAGSVFKNPDGDYAGRIIESLGLKGLSVGDAIVSEKHANFIVNNGKATERDVRQLVELVQERVREMTGIELKREVRYFTQGDLKQWR